MGRPVTPNACLAGRSLQTWRAMNIYRYFVSAALLGALAACPKPKAPAPSGPAVLSCVSPNGTCRESGPIAEFQKDCEEKAGTYANGPCPAEGLMGSCALTVDKGAQQGQPFTVKFYEPARAEAAGAQCVRFGGKFTPKN